MAIGTIWISLLGTDGLAFNWAWLFGWPWLIHLASKVSLAISVKHLRWKAQIVYIASSLFRDGDVVSFGISQQFSAEELASVYSIFVADC